MTTEPSDRRLAVTMRLSSGYLLDLLPLIAGPMDLVDAIIMLAIVQSNVWPITRDPLAQARFGGIGDLPPDEARRPTSISALAASLKLPYETVRRRVRRLEAQGRCQVTPQGVLAPASQLDSPAHEAALRAGVRLTRDFYDRLRAEDAIDEVPRGTAPAETPVRAMARVVSDYFLRMTVALTERYGDPLDGFILMQIVRVNARGHAADAGSGEAILPDPRRRAAPVSLVARALGLGHELVRRRTNALIARGACARAAGGLIVPQQRLASEELRRLMRFNYTCVGRMFAELGRMGALR